MTDRRRLALARSIMTEPWTTGRTPPRRERGEQRERRQVWLPPWMWADLGEVAQASGLSRDEIVRMVLFRWLRDSKIHPR